MTPIRNLKRPKLTDTVAERLTVAIRGGEFSPGDGLPTEQELGKRFGVSRNVVREAINELRARGMVETRQGFGSVVTGEFHKPIRHVMRDLVGDQDGAEGKLLETPAGYGGAYRRTRRPTGHSLANRGDGSTPRCLHCCQR